MKALKQQEMFGGPMTMDACFSVCGQYRYTLSRTWKAEGRLFVIIMLNPSTANAEKNDPTTIRCLNFAKREGCGRYMAVNLFALRSTDPAELKLVADPVGPDNARYLMKAVRRADLVVAAWGNDGAYLGRDREVIGMLRRCQAPVHCFGLTERAHPKFPLYLRHDTKLVDFI